MASRFARPSPVAERLGPYLGKELWAPLSIWLPRFKYALGLKQECDLLYLLQTLGASWSYAPEISLAELSAASHGIPLSTLHGWIRKLEKGGFLEVIRTKTPSGDYGPNRYVVRPMLEKIETMHRALVGTAAEGSPDSHGEVSGSTEPTTPESGDGLRTMPEVVLRLSGEKEEREETVPPDVEKQFRGLALAHATTFKLKAGSETFRNLWRALHTYAALHGLSRREMETLLSAVSQDKRYLSPEGLWSGLDAMVAVWPAKKAVAA